MWDHHADFDRLLVLMEKERNLDYEDIESVKHHIKRVALVCPHCEESFIYPRQSFGALDGLTERITRENGGWGGGIWQTPGIGYGGRNHGWSAKGAAAWYEANGFKQFYSTEFDSCKYPAVDSFFALIFAGMAASLLFKAAMHRFSRFYLVSTVSAAAFCLSCVVRSSSRSDSIDIATILSSASMSMIVWACWDAFLMSQYSQKCFHWKTQTRDFIRRTLTIVLVCSTLATAFDRVLFLFGLTNTILLFALTVLALIVNAIENDEKGTQERYLPRREKFLNSEQKKSNTILPWHVTLRIIALLFTVEILMISSFISLASMVFNIHCNAPHQYAGTLACFLFSLSALLVPWRTLIFYRPTPFEEVEIPTTSVGEFTNKGV